MKNHHQPFEVKTMFYKLNVISTSASKPAAIHGERGANAAAGICRTGLAVLASGFFLWSGSLAGAATTSGTDAMSGGAGGVSATIGSPEPGGNLLGPGVTASIDSSTPEFADSDIIAHVGDKNIKVEDLRVTIASLEPSERNAMAANPAMLRRVILSLLVERMIVKEITEKKWDEQSDVKAHLERVRLTTLAEMYLQSVAQPPGNYPSDEELHKTYEANKDSLKVPQQFRIAQIFVALPPNGDKTAIAKAGKKLEKVIEELKKPGADFGKIAHAESEETGSAAQGGEMGWIDQKQMPPKIRLAAMSISRNTPSAPIKINDGWHIIKVLDAKDPVPVAFDEIKEKLIQTLRAKRAEANRHSFVLELLKQNPVSLNDKALEKVLNQPTNQP